MTWREQDHPRDEIGRFTFKEKLRQEEIALHKNDNKKAPAYTDAEVNALERQNINTDDIKPKKKPFIMMQLFSGKERKEPLKPGITKSKQEKIINYLINLEPITLDINGESITAVFDEFGVNKYLYGDKKSTTQGFNNVKLKLLTEIKYSISNAKYNYSQLETHKKNTPVHNNSKLWHYLNSKIKDKNGKSYLLIVNVRKSLDDKYYFYDIQVK
jgi:hypothetical protein